MPTQDKSKGLAIPQSFTFPKDADTDVIEGHQRQNSLFCVDVSHYTGTSISFSSLRLQSVRCVYAKATQGIKGKDGQFKSYWNALAKYSGLTVSPADRLSRGAYHFLSSSAPGKDQADAFVDYVNLNGGFLPGDLPPVMDLEWDVTAAQPVDQWRGQPTDKIVQNALAFLSRVKERTGRTPIIYTALSWWTDKTIPSSRFKEFKEYPLWIADYNPKRKLSETPAVPNGAQTVLWQFSDRAHLNSGFSGGLDASIFYGSEADFASRFGLTGN
ncbi:GH25 family lysozyme [Rhizobium rhizogenes]|uniref:Lysozyme n=1 Tax=Rhizobium rhizogenes NBRC 13257 TaxID=1220581 RepID=A0AA87QDA4_RHIRH|nr:GH25 family lysozyme [Rhizobium rhizogenes]NTG71237.1 glycoside hydrolase [Rhizobium rhizogenes]NTG90544.1 glycoside hydrolase [Rhizobium rhizogenes]GAJ96049.1 putative lysozyme [Rhizobium rhizogenes NBRC 13257]